MGPDTTPRAVHIALVEDHEATRELLSQKLRQAPERIASVLAVPDGETLLASQLNEVEVALVDLRLPGMSGVQTIARMAEVAPKVRSAALTVFDDASSLVEAISAGAVGYILKSEPFERVLQAISEAADNQHPVSSRVAGYLLTHLRPQSSPLTSREQQLAASLAEGLSYLDAANRFGIALGTVQHHVKNIYRKLGVSTKEEVREWVQRHALKR